MAAKPIPDGYHTATPYLIVRDAARAIAFYTRAFGATELMRLPAPNGKMGNAEIKIGNSLVMLADEFPDMGYRSPQSLGGAAVSIVLYVEDVDEQFSQAIAAGAKALKQVGISSTATGLGRWKTRSDTCGRLRRIRRTSPLRKYSGVLRCSASSRVTPN